MSTPVSISPAPILQFFNNLGNPNANGSVLTQVGGVNYPTYQDSAGTIALPNPIPLNSRGEVSNASGVSCQLFLQIGTTYVFTLFDAGGNQLNQATYVSQATNTGSTPTLPSLIVTGNTTLNGGLTLSSAATQAIVSATFPSPADDLENILINGDLRISQVNGSSGIAVSNTSIYTVDQWLTNCSLGAGTGSISVTRGGPASGLSAGGSQYDLSFSVGTANASPAAGNFCITENRSEGLNTQKLNWGNGNASSVTLQFRFFTSIANAVLPIAFVNGAGNRSYVTSITTGVAGTWAMYSVTVPGDVAGTWAMDNTLGLRVIFGWAVGTTFQTPANTWTAGLFYGVSGATNFMSSVSNSWGLTDIDLKAGSLVLPITRRSYEAELLLCQRYLPAFNSTGTTAALCPAFAQSATSILGQITYPVPTRVPPTGITISSAAHFTQINGAASAALSALVFNSIISNVSAIIAGTSTGMTNGFAGALYFNSASGQLVFTGCQL